VLEVAVVRTPAFCRVGYSPARMAAQPPLPRDIVLEKVRARILAAARARLTSADAEDLTQEALVLLATKYAEVEAPEELLALGLAILRKKRVAFWRKAARRRALGDAPLPARDDAEGRAIEDTPDAGPDPEAVTRARERLGLFVAAASRLDGRCREILRRKVLGASFVEIAAELGRPVNTVYSWDWRCHERLRKLLGDRWSFVAGEEDR
jgi:RNA polymerase sigma factor (sigma-70 family)